MRKYASLQHARPARSSFRGGATWPLLFFLLCVPTINAQVAVRGELFRGIVVRPGQTVRLGVGVVNLGTEPATLKLRKTDFTAGKVVMNEPRSAMAWCALPAGAVTLPVGPTEVPVVFHVPSDASGSHWMAVAMASTSTPASQGIGVGVVTQYVLQVCLTVPGGHRAVSLGEPMIKGTSLTVPVIGEGDEVFVVTISAKGLPDKQIRVFPGTTRLLEYDIKDFPTGVEHSLRMVIDDGADLLRPQTIRFTRKAEPPLALLAQREREREKARQFQAHLSAVLTYGVPRKGVFLQGSLHAGPWSLNLGTEQRFFSDTFYQAYTVRTGLRLGHFSIGAGKQWYGNYQSTFLRTSVQFKGLTGSFSYIPEYQIASVQASAALAKNITAQVYAVRDFRTGRFEWNTSAIIRIF